MNIEHLNTLVKRIEQCEYREEFDRGHNQNSFNMAAIFFNCDGSACIAGHCSMLLTKKEKDAINNQWKAIKNARAELRQLWMGPRWLQTWSGFTSITNQ